MLSHCVIAFLLIFDYSLGQEQPLVETSLGPIIGHHKRSYGGRTFSAFEGIPYAKPPVGDLRFEEPLSVEPWTGVWNATVSHACIQLNWFTGTLAGSEDCLYLNVYVPKDKPVPNENLDVIVHIHGGAFMVGSQSLGGPEYFMDRDNIVYVTLNYRLGVLGFLSTEDDVVPGNNGMKDQVLALKWVQNHIKKFGGNPKSVTIIGLSAGGGSVHLHYFSQLTKGLFHRGISQSGTALAPWAIKEAPLKSARKLAASIGCYQPSSKDFIQCLKQRPANQVIQNGNSLSPFPGMPIVPFGPVIERQSKSAFLTDYPYKLLKRGKVIDVPWITSATTEEGILGLMSFNNKFDELNEKWNDMLPYFLDYVYTVDESDKPEVAEKLKQFYFDGEKVSEENIQSLIKLGGDRYFVLNLEESARMHAKFAKSPVYSYFFGYKSDHNLTAVMGLTKNYGVGHGEDGLLLYQMSFGDFEFKTEKFSESDEQIKELFLDAVTSFAKDGKPEVKNVIWDPVKDSADFQYLFIHNDGVKMVSEKEVAPTEFWKSLPIRENGNIVTSKDEL